MGFPGVKKPAGQGRDKGAILVLLDPTCLSLSLSVLLPFASTGEYFWLEPKNAFENFQEPDIGLIALAFLQGSFAYGGWNFLNYVTEELVDPYK